MCSAIAQALSMSPKPRAPGARNTGALWPWRRASSMRASEPEMFGTPSMSGAISGTLTLLWQAGSLVADVIVDVDVVLAGPSPGMILAHAVEDQLPKLLRIVVPQADGAHHG